MFHRKKAKSILGICWDNRRYHLLVARIDNECVSILATASEFWSDRFSASEVAETVRQHLKKLSIRSPHIVIGIARSQADFISFEAPPANDSELPILVRNLVARQFSELADDDIVDFVKREESPDQPVAIEAAVVHQSIRNEIGALADELGEKPSSIVVRTFSVASLFNRLVKSTSRSVVINRLDESADFLVIHDGTTVFSRTVRFESDLAEEFLAAQMAEEITRTMAATPDLGNEGDEIHNVYCFGSAKCDRYVGFLADELGTGVRRVDPFEGTESHLETVDQTCPFAALIGMVRDFSQNEAPIDFVNPKQAPSPPNRVRQTVFYATAALVMVAMLYWHLTEDLRGLREENAKTQTEIEQTGKYYQMLRKQTIMVDEVSKWRQDEVNWLDELRDLSRRFPNRQDAIVNRMSFAGNRTSLSVRVREPEIMAQMEDALRDLPFRSVSSKRISQNNDQSKYRCQFETTLTTAPRRPKTHYLKPVTTVSTALDDKMGDSHER